MLSDRSAATMSKGFDNDELLCICTAIGIAPQKGVKGFVTQGSLHKSIGEHFGIENFNNNNDKLMDLVRELNKFDVVIIVFINKKKWKANR